MKYNMMDRYLFGEYQMVYNCDPPENLIQLIDGLDLSSVLFQLAYLNYRLRPMNKVYSYFDENTQVANLLYFTKDNKQYSKYEIIFHRAFELTSKHPIIFSRVTCLYAMNYLIGHSQDLKLNEDLVINDCDYHKILDFILAINQLISKTNFEFDSENAGLDHLNHYSIPLNEYDLPSDPLYIPVKGMHFVEHIMGTKFQFDFEDYINSNHGLQPKEYVKFIFRLVILNNKELNGYPFVFGVNNSEIIFFENLCLTLGHKNFNALINIKKAPFFRLNHNGFLLLDYTLLLEKTWNQLVMDFWFDFLKPKYNNQKSETNALKEYKGEIGKFFEKYVCNIFKNSLRTNKHYKVFCTDDLKINEENIEVADLYIRYNNKILIAQIRSTHILDSKKYSGSLDKFYSKGKEEFLNSFSLKQLAESIEQVRRFAHRFDPGFRKTGQYKIYPCLVLSDQVFQLPLMVNLFHDEFKNYCSNIDSNKFKLHSLALFHVSDLEYIQYKFKDNPNIIWKLLDKYHNSLPFKSPIHTLMGENYSRRPNKEETHETYHSFLEIS